MENPTTGEILSVISAASMEDTHKVVQSAKLGFKTWRSHFGSSKARLLLKLADLIERDAQELASPEAVDVSPECCTVCSLEHFSDMEMLT